MILAAHLVKEKRKYGLRKYWLVSSDRDWDLTTRKCWQIFICNEKRSYIR